MAAKAKNNPYEGKIEFSINGQSANTVGQEYIGAVVMDWFIRSMYRVLHDDPAFAPFLEWEYLGIDCEKYKKTEKKDEQ